jgi:GT2 family glycosyltransferase
LSSISVLIVNYKNCSDTIDCVKSVVNQNNSPVQIIIIENGSNDGSYERLSNAFPNVVIIRLKNNLGFAGANNVGIKYAIEHGADYIFLLNNDAYVEPNTIQHLLDAFEKDPKIGIVGATVLDYYHPLIIDNKGAIINFYTGYSDFVDHGVIYQFNNKFNDVDYACGAAMMIKREVIDAVGLMSEFYFLYGEEKDYCLRVKLKGYRIVATTAAAVTHKGSSTMKKFPGIKNYYFHRNRFLTMKLYSNWHQYCFAILHSVFFILPYYLVSYLFRNSNPRNGLHEVRNFVRGVLDGIRFKTGYVAKV